ncbi:unnamed protein product [marine sediment metagenome]|uniref:Uncharacterized protein n=1 Tax=marine sediment metagenome TaxID=412755 RepID=X0SG67_9ZZZZ
MSEKLNLCGMSRTGLKLIQAYHKPHSKDIITEEEWIDYIISDYFMDYLDDLHKDEDFIKLAKETIEEEEWESILNAYLHR